MASASKAIAMSAAGSRKGPGVLADLGDLIRTIKTLFDPYRPELHYMRGPGPKWHAKHDPVSGSAEADLVPVMIRMRR
jgi:hypothetical protein